MNSSLYHSFGRLLHERDRLHEAGPWDYLLSAFDETERVQWPFERIQASEKEWIVHEEYDIDPQRYPEKHSVWSSSFRPPEVLEFVRERAAALRSRSVCIDATGFVRPHLLVLLWALREAGIRRFDVLYNDPIRYVADEKTEFATGPVESVRQVPGYAGIHHSSSRRAQDLLIIGAGYDYEQIARACDSKLSTRRYVLTGLPSLRPHMYQESVLRINRARDAIGELRPDQRLYAAANQPFGVARIVGDLLRRESEEAKARGRLPGNVYLCPVGPKPHAIGFALLYLRELLESPVSIIYPFRARYSSQASEGHLRTWQFRVEL